MLFTGTYIYLSFFLICCNITSVLCFGFLVARHMESYFSNQGLNPHPLHWKVKSYSLDCQGSPTVGDGSVQFSSVAQLCPTLCDPMDWSTPDFPVHHQLPGFTQTHVRWAGDAIQPSHPLSSPSSSLLQSFLASGSFQMSQFYTSGGQSIEVSASASVLPMNIQDWFPLGLTGWLSLLSKGLSRLFSKTTVQKAISVYSLWLKKHLSNLFKWFMC